MGGVNGHFCNHFSGFFNIFTNSWERNETNTLHTRNSIVNLFGAGDD